MDATASPADAATLMAALARSAGGPPRAYLAAARTTLSKLLARADLLDRVVLDRRPGGFTRNLLFGQGRMSVWAIVWSPGATTPVHDHHCSCCFGVLGGRVRETWYRAISDTHAVAVGEAVRAPGHIACMMPSGPNLHRMTNDGPFEAVSLHVYGYDHEVHATSIERTYRVAAG